MAINNSLNRISEKLYRNSSPPRWVSASQIAVDSLFERASSDDLNIVSDSTLTVATSSTGANGLLVSSALIGSVSITNGSATVTGSGTQFTNAAQGFVVGDSMNTPFGARRVVAIANDTSLTVDQVFSSTQSGLAYTRGNKRANCAYYLYAIAKSDGSNPALILSTRSTAWGHTFPAADLPAGYTKYREMPLAICLDSSGNICNFYIGEGWPNGPVILYEMGQDTSGSDLLLYSGAPSTNAAAPTTVSSFPLLPLTADIALINLWSQGATGGRVYVRAPSYAYDQVDTLSSESYGTNAQSRVILKKSDSGQFSIRAENSGMNIYLWINGYIVTQTA